MQFWRAMAEVFFGNQNDEDTPTAEDRDDAEAVDQLIHDEDTWQEGVDMGTIPDTPRGYESGDTDPEHPSTNAEPWYRKYFPW